MRLRAFRVSMVLLAVAAGITGCGSGGMLSQGNLPMILSLTATADPGGNCTASVTVSSHTKGASLSLTVAAVDALGGVAGVYERELEMGPAAGDKTYTFSFSTPHKGQHAVTARAWGLAGELADLEETAFTVGSGRDSTEPSTTTTTQSTTTTAEVATTTTAQTTAQLPAINGHWAGTFTYTVVKGDTLGPKTLAWVGVVHPMTLDVDLDAQGQGTATMFVDSSSVGINGAYVTRPAVLTDDLLTLTWEPTTSIMTMAGQVSSEGGRTVITGSYMVTEPQDPSILFEAEWQVFR